MVDLAKVASKGVEDSTFDFGEPSLPFVQLLTVCHPKSAINLLPKKYSSLQKHPKLKAFYPDSFEIDYEGKTKEHMAVSLLCHADVDLIKQVYESKAASDTTIRERNMVGVNELYEYRKGYVSSYNSKYGNLPKNKIKMTR
jgi:5'-3' exonuclease